MVVRHFYPSLEIIRLCHKLWFSNPYIFATKCGRLKIFQTMNFVRQFILNVKYKRFTPSGYKDIGMRKILFAAKTHFLLKILELQLFNCYLSGNSKQIAKICWKCLFFFYFFHFFTTSKPFNSVSFTVFNLIKNVQKYLYFFKMFYDHNLKIRKFEKWRCNNWMRFRFPAL